MARQVTCVCGRDFHIGHSQSCVQCRQCGRWYDGEELGVVGVAASVLRGSEVARIEHKAGNRKVSRATTLTGDDKPTANALHLIRSDH